MSTEHTSPGLGNLPRKSPGPGWAFTVVINSSNSNRIYNLLIINGLQVKWVIISASQFDELHPSVQSLVGRRVIGYHGQAFARTVSHKTVTVHSERLHQLVLDRGGAAF